MANPQKIDPTDDASGSSTGEVLQFPAASTTQHFEITAITNANGPCTKRIYLGADGRPASDPAAQIWAGRAERLRTHELARKSSPLQTIANGINRLKDHQALCMGRLIERVGDTVDIVTKEEYEANPKPGTISRTKDFLYHAPGVAALLPIDFDRKGMPRDIADRIESAGGAWNSIAEVFPELANAGRISRASTSAGIYHTETGECFDSGGEHHYLAMKDGSDIERTLDDMHDRAWLNGLGWWFVSASGALLERSIIDKSVGSPERLFFEGPPTVDPPLKQDLSIRQAKVTEGSVLDTKVAIPPPDLAGRRKVEALKKKEKQRLQPEADRRRKEWNHARAEEIVERTGISHEDALRQAKACHDYRLMPLFLLVFVDPNIGTVPVEEVLKNPTRFLFKKLADPLEGVAYGQNKAMVMRRFGTRELFIRSFAHGGINYELAYDGATVQDPDLVELNGKHCVANMGGKFVVITETIDLVGGEAMVTFSKIDDFKNLYGNRKKTIKKDGNDKNTPLTKWWLEHPQRRQYGQVVFAPGKEIPGAYNLWRGFAVAPDSINSEAKCALYLAHIRDNICQGNEELYGYVLRWMANGVQNPDRPGGAALVLRGNMGIGKGEFVRHYGSLFGANFIPVVKPEHLTGRFNAHVGEAIVLFGDECFFPGNPQHEQILKGLVTEQYGIIERKNVDPIRFRSCLHIVLACNNDWSVPVSHGDRRYCCIEVGDACKGNHAYFADIDSQMRNGGREALLGFLQAVDLTGFHPENFPRTAEHDRQRAQSRHGIDLFIEKICRDGRVPCASGTRPGLAITSGEEHRRGFDYYINHVAPAELKRMGAQKVKAALERDWGCHGRREGSGDRRWGWQFPPLAELRQTFAKKHGSMDWSEDITEWETGSNTANDCFEFPH